MTGVFIAGQVLTAANLNTAINSLTLNAQTGSGYTLVLADAGKLVTVSNASAQNLTIPLNSSVAYSTGTVIEVLNIGAGTWTLTPTGGVTLTGSTSIGTNVRVVLTKTGTDTWYASTIGGSGLTLVATATASAVGSLSINSCFTSTYANYRIIFDLTNSATGFINLRMRASSSDDTSGIYSHGSRYFYPSSTDGYNAGSAATSYGMWNSNTTRMTAVIDILGPQTATITTGGTVISGKDNSGTIAMALQSFYFDTTTQYDGFTLFPASGTITSSTNGIRVYGYSNS